MAKTLDVILVIDVESTCWEGYPPPGQMTEIIEVGLCLVDTASLERLEKRSLMVRPQKSTVSAFCTELTGITQEMLADAPAFPEAMEALREAMLVGRWGVVWGSWGLFDQTQLRRDCDFHGVEYPMPEHMNLKNVFSAAQGRRKRYGMSKALRLCGLGLEGSHHRALDDAKNIARLLPWIVGGQRLPTT